MEDNEGHGRIAGRCLDAHQACAHQRLAVLLMAFSLP
jgi:hypothetical protein